MKFKYISGANNTTATVTLDDGSSISTAGLPLAKAGTDVVIYKIFVGIPVGGGNIVLKNKALAMAFATDTSDSAFKYTYPATLTSSYQYVYPTTFDFGEKGLTLDGGNVQIDQTMQVTVLWDYAPAA